MITFWKFFTLGQGQCQPIPNTTELPLYYIKCTTPYSYLYTSFKARGEKNSSYLSVEYIVTLNQLQCLSTNNRGSTSISLNKLHWYLATKFTKIKSRVYENIAPQQFSNRRYNTFSSCQTEKLILKQDSPSIFKYVGTIQEWNLGCGNFFIDTTKDAGTI